MLLVTNLQLLDALPHVQRPTVDGRIILRIRVCADDLRCHFAVCVDLSADVDVGKRFVEFLFTVGRRILHDVSRRLLQAIGGAAHSMM